MKRSIIFLSSLSLLLFAQPSLGASSALKNNDDGEKKKINIIIDQYSEDISRDTIDGWVTHQNALYLSSKSSEFENISYCPTNEVFCSLTLTRLQRQQIGLASKISFNEEAIKSYTEDLARKVNRQPTDAKFKVENGIVGTFEEAKYGISLKVNESIEQLKDSIINEKQEATLAFDKIESSTNYGDINNLGISALLGEGSSDFKGSPSNRVHNIKVATQRYNGVLIKPGEEFSFVKYLGEVDGEHGYLPELVIKKNITEPEFGGGICQVSSTAFRAAIYSGLKITARRNHAYPVSYYAPQGMDATIYVPNPDLKFLNNTPGYILIQTKIVGTKLTFSFYGTNDGRETKVDGPRVIERQPDGALKTTFSQTVIDKDGKEFISDVFNSSYSSPYLFPHPGGPTLSTKPSNWSDEQWKNYKKMLKDIAKASANKS
ncbi:MAG: VanW family protein [uncultured bacterium]|nr:MAG: VanW family protein [uncultured bacterium]